jgi:hypothetical protein
VFNGGGCGVYDHQTCFGESYDRQTWNDVGFGRGRHYGRRYGMLFDYETLLYIVKRKYYFPKGFK